MTFGGRVALVTGAGSGMGQLSAWRLAAEGVAVAALDVDEEGLERTATHAPTVTPVVCDVTDPDAVTQAVAHVTGELGPIDRLTHAAAICPSGPLDTQALEEIRRVMEVNYFGTVHVTRAVLDGMLERGSGDVVLYASLAGWLPAYGVGAYSATKAAVVSFAEVLAHEIAGRGVRLACVCPPVVDTPLLDKMAEADQTLVRAQRPMRPEVVVDAVEAALDRGALFVWPNAETRVALWVRRLAPSLLWRRMDQIRGASGDTQAAL